MLCKDDDMTLAFASYPNQRALNSLEAVAVSMALKGHDASDPLL